MLDVIKQEYKYERSTITGAFCNPINFNQRNDESLKDYAKHFIAAKDAVNSQLGSNIIAHKDVEFINRYNVSYATNDKNL